MGYSQAVNFCIHQYLFQNHVIGGDNCGPCSMNVSIANSTYLSFRSSQSSQVDLPSSKTTIEALLFHLSTVKGTYHHPTIPGQ